jgi:hypothetical protein
MEQPSETTPGPSAEAPQPSTGATETDAAAVIPGPNVAQSPEPCSPPKDQGFNPDPPPDTPAPMPCREIDTGADRASAVYCMDGVGPGNACHEYVVSGKAAPLPLDRISTIHFQTGPIKEAGVNGCQNEDLIAIVIDRLTGFQSGKFACVENHKALGHLKNAMKQLNARTVSRIRRGVEGENKE